MVRINKLFEIEYGNQFDKNKMIEGPGGVHFVSRSSANLGVNATVERVPNVTPYSPGLITVTLGGTYLLSSFVQPREFYTAQNIKVLRPQATMTFNRKVFCCLAISENRFRYTSHGREANKTFDDILIPDTNAVPEWVDEAEWAICTPESVARCDDEWNIEGWAGFRLSDIFEIRKGRRLTRASLGKGRTPFIGAIDKNNGVREWVDAVPNHKGNTISVNYNGSVAEAFYQPVPYWASDDVNVLYPRFEMTAAIGLFLCTLIRKEGYRFNYGRKWHLGRMADAFIRLPVRDEGSPDWDFMERMMGSLPYSARVGES